MKSLMWVLALFVCIKGSDLYSRFIDKQHKKVKNSIGCMYGSNPLEGIGIKFPRVVQAQIALETRWLSSKIYKENHNLFGMKESSRNWDCGSQYGHAKYTDCGRSLLDYKGWQLMRFEQAKRLGMHIPETDEEYIYFLQHLPGGGAYAEDPLYPSKLRHIMNL